jgi:hypothetical protein
MNVRDIFPISRQFVIFKDGCPEEWIKWLMAFREMENLISVVTVQPRHLQLLLLLLLACAQSFMRLAEFHQRSIICTIKLCGVIRNGFQIILPSQLGFSHQRQLI